MGKSYWEISENWVFMFSYSHKRKTNLSRHQGNDYALDQWWGLKAKSLVFYNKSTSYTGNDNSVWIFVFPSSSLCKTVRIRNCSKMVYSWNENLFMYLWRGEICGSAAGEGWSSGFRVWCKGGVSVGSPMLPLAPAVSRHITGGGKWPPGLTGDLSGQNKGISLARGRVGTCNNLLRQRVGMHTRPLGVCSVCGLPDAAVWQSPHEKAL